MYQIAYISTRKYPNIVHVSFIQVSLWKTRPKLCLQINWKFKRLITFNFLMSVSWPTLFIPASLASSFLVRSPFSLILSPSEGGGVLPRFLFWCHRSGSQDPRLFLKASSKYDGHVCDMTAVLNSINSSAVYIIKSSLGSFTCSSSASSLTSMSTLSGMSSSTVNCRNTTSKYNKKQKISNLVWSKFSAHKF